MSEKIRVAMLGPYPMSTSHISGGVQAAYAYLLKGLTQNDQLDIHVLTIRPGDYTGSNQFIRNKVTVHLLPLYPRYERLRNYRTYQSMICNELSHIQPDLIHAQEASSDALVALRSGYPTVITVHGIQWEDGKHYSSFNTRLHHYYDSVVTERYVMRHARHLIAISHYVSSYFKHIMRPDVEINYVSNAIDERFFELDQFPDKKVVLFAGRVIPRKHVMELVQSFALVLLQEPTAQLHIAGEFNTEPDYVNSIRRWARQAHIENHIQFLGHLSEEKILQEFAGCTILALPSAQETAPMVIAQAMAAGKPVVATRVGGIGEMVAEDGTRGLLVDVGDIESLAAAMIRLLQNPELQSKMGECARRFAQENYHLKSVSQRTFDVYHRIANNEEKAFV